MGRQDYWNSAYTTARGKGYGASDAKRIANDSLKGYTPEVVTGKKSIAMASSSLSGNVIDVLLGYPGDDIQSMYGGPKLDDSGWSNVPTKPLVADLEHFADDMAEGIRNDLEEKWQDFAVLGTDHYLAEDGLRTKVTIPDTELGNEFLERYNRGEFGASVEYKGIKDGNVIKDWEITGFTFTEDPSYHKTKPKAKSEN